VDTQYYVEIPNVTVSIDDSLKEQMNDHPEINWSEVARQAIRAISATSR